MEVTHRGTCRGQVTKIINAVNEFLSRRQILPDDGPEPSSDVIELEVLKKRLETALELLRRANDAVKGLIPRELFEKESESILEYEDKVATATALIDCRLSLYQELRRRNELTPRSANVKTPLAVPENEAVPEIQEVSRSIGTNVRLPKLELRKFNGSLEDWVPFWEQYKSSIHDNASLSAASKFNYLQNVLTGKAADTVRGFTPTESCYNDAIQLLIEQFGNTDKIADKCIQRLMSLKQATSRFDVIGLRTLYNNVLSVTRSLTALNIQTCQYSIMLKPIIVKALPSDLRIEFYRSIRADATKMNGSSNNTNNTILESTTACNSINLSRTSTSEDTNSGNPVDELLNFLKKELEALEKSVEASGFTQAKGRTSYVAAKCTAANLFTAGTSTVSCVFCNSISHRSSDCKINMPIVKKKEILKAQRRCFRCTSANHISKRCRIQMKCDVCSGKHATVMCDPNFRKTLIAKKDDQDSCKAMVSGNGTEVVNLYTTNQCPADVLLQTARAYVCTSISDYDPWIRIVLDGGSQLTFVKEKVAKDLDLPVIGKQRLTILPFGATGHSPPRTCDKVQLKLRSQFGEIIQIQAIVVPKICVDMLSVPNSDHLQFKGLKLADMTPTKEKKSIEGISVLIGSDYYWAIVNTEQKRLSERLVAINSKLGWIIHGAITNRNSVEQSKFILSAFVETETEEFNFKNLWSLEALGITSEHTSEGFTEQFIQQSIFKKSGYYEVSLPWKHPIQNFSDNKNCAKYRLNGLIRKLQRDPDRLCEYDEAIRSYLNDGYAEIVSESGCSELQRIYYMPHRAVYREDKATTRVRIVFDASSHSEGSTSLNDNLWPGENINTDLLTVLINFRIGVIGLVADIEKAFLRIKLAPEDRDVHRFLWFSKTPKPAQILPPFQEFRMTSVTFGVTCSPFLLGATIRTHLTSERENYPVTCEHMLRSFYVDDFVCSVNDQEIAKQIYQESCSIMRGAGMRLRKWTTNDDILRKIFNKDGHLSESDHCHKLLGLNWWIHSDELSLSLEAVNDFVATSPVATKRSVLQAMSRIYDPLGLIGPFTVKLKILLQTIWKLKIPWDDAISEDMAKVWRKWCKELDELKEFAVPRCILGDRLEQQDDLQLHLFADASPAAFGTVAYLRRLKYSGKIEVNIICSRNRLAPLKDNREDDLSLPKLELTAALIAARLQCYLNGKLNLSINQTYLWSDSKIALFWIRGDGNKWKPYVRSRVLEIKKSTQARQWKHCAGADNPADLLTRGVAAKILKNSDLWIQGPEWLRESECKWPLESDELEIKSVLETVVREDEIKDIATESIICLTDFSSLSKLLRVKALVSRFINNLRCPDKRKDFISTEELKEAEMYWIKCEQRKFFNEEIDDLNKKLPIRVSSKLVSFAPYLDEYGVLRIGGRLQFAREIGERAHPVILPKSSHLSKLIVQSAHVKMLHNGMNAVLSTVRERFWIIRARQLIKQVLSQCIVCKRLHGKPASEPFAPLPEMRVNASKPFETTGVDFAGPLYIKGVTEDEEKRKVYIMLLTCAATRALHLESVLDLSAESCMRGLRRFVSRRGVPKAFYSDNAKTFKRASEEMNCLKTTLQSSDLVDFVTQQGSSWRFIVERAAWWGGFWERLVRSVKNALKATIGRQLLGYDELQTLLTEVEATINARPLTYMSNDPNDLEPLTPAHFLLGHKPTMLPTFDLPSPEARDGRSDLLQRWRARAKCLKFFWRRWTIDYLQQLRSAHQSPITFSSNLKEGTVVLVYDKATPRILWKMARVEKTFPGRDGKIRACEIQLANGSRLRRPVQLLYPLELK